MNSIRLNDILQSARQRKTIEVALSGEADVNSVMVGTRDFRFNGRSYFAGDRLNMAADAAKGAHQRGDVTVMGGGLCDRSRIGDYIVYRPWRLDPPQPQSQIPFGEVLIRCRVNKLVSIIMALDPGELFNAESFYLPWGYIQEMETGFDLESEEQGKALSLCDPQY